MSKKTFALILIVVVIVSFVIGFAVAKNGGKEEETTVPEINDIVETVADDTTEEITEEETETETETETTEESTTEKVLKSETIDTAYFTLETPAEWYGEYSYKIKNPNSDDSFIMVFTHNDSQKDGMDGKVFEIDVYPQEEGDNPEDIPGATLKGTLITDGQKFNVVLRQATDVRYTDESADGYAEIRDRADEFLASLNTKDGVEFVANGSEE